MCDASITSKVFATRHRQELQAWGGWQGYFCKTKMDHSDVTGRTGENPLCPRRPPPLGYGEAWLSESDPKTEAETSPSWWP